MGIDRFQAEIARIALAAAYKHGFALAGGNALIAHGLVDRPTQDVDLFTPDAGAPGAAAELVCHALQNAGFRVELVRRPEDSAGEFAQLAVSREEETTLLDLARDWRQHPAVDLDIGPVLHVDDAVASKVTAMVGRSLPRDFIDVAASLNRYTRDQLMVLAFTRDPGLRVMDFTAAAHALDDIPAEAFTPYGLDVPAVARLRARFADWPRDVSSDDAGHRAHAAAHPPPGSTGPGLREPLRPRSATSARSAAPDNQGPQPPSL